MIVGSGLPELSGDEIDRLTAVELELWAADQACQDDVGYAEYNLRREQEIVDLTLAIIAINGWNRLSIAFRAKAGTYQPPRHGK